MNNIAFLDIEVGTTNEKIDRLGYLSTKSAIDSSSVRKIKNTCLQDDIDFICGHNFIEHDAKFLEKTSFNQILESTKIIDTLYLSMLLFPNISTHKLDKPYKDNHINIENQPLGDSEQTQVLFIFLNKKFDQLSIFTKNIFFKLLKNDKHFSGFFIYKSLSNKKIDTYEQIKKNIVVKREDYVAIEREYPVELAFIISYLVLNNQGAISPVILARYPKIVKLLKILTFDKNNVDIESFSQNEFGISSFREFDKNDANIGGLYSSKISQKDIIENGIGNDSLLAILPTGGGKTFTFQLPALLKAQKYKGLSVVISPLQALMKDQIDSFKRKNNNFKVIAISGFLSPIERMNAIIEVEDGVADILYLAPESLRSNSIFRVLKKRVIERFIIDEAHCFSSWGHDFRHDYYFIADTIKELEKSEFQSKIPISCFTATAKPEVILDIKQYFKDKLNIELKEFVASVERYNLKYEVVSVKTQEDKYEKLVKILNELGRKPTIIYIPQNAKECRTLSDSLNNDERMVELDLVIEPFYAKLDDDKESGKRPKEARSKGEILTDFIANKIDVVIATTAFGMGIDKADVQTVIHYQQSDSLESYLQESGRGARDENLEARCIVLYSKTDFDNSFKQLNRSKVDLSEIKRIVRALKNYSNDKLYLSPKDIAKKMGVDIEDSSIDYEVVIKTALLELEKHHIIERGRDGYKIFATSVDKKENIKGMPFVHEVLDPKQHQTPYIELYQDMILVMQNIINRSKLDAIEVDDLSDVVGVEKSKIFRVLNQLQKDGLLKFENDISVYLKQSVRQEFETHFALEKRIFKAFKDLPDYERSINLRSLNNENSNDIVEFKQIIQSWVYLSKFGNMPFTARFKNDICSFEIEDKALLEKMINGRSKLSKFIIEQLLLILGKDDGVEVEFSSNKIKLDYPSEKLTMDAFHHTFVYLHETLKGFELRRGRLIYYQTYSLTKQERIETRMPYKKEHYKEGLMRYYLLKIEAIHIQIVFLEKLLAQGWNRTKGFVVDYFSMEYQKFKKSYKELNSEEIKRPVTKEKFIEILQNLNPEQRKIFDDSKSNAIMVLAGPGSGKTKTLVHKIASLITIENNKAEYFLMLAHSRVAVSDFRNKLKTLIGNQAYEMKIHTFHSFAISLLGKNIDTDIDLAGVMQQATNKLNNGDIKIPFISMLVVDEYQDVGKQSYGFIKAIYTQMGSDKDDKKIIAVGDDDQCIKNFGDDRADIRFITKFKDDFGKGVVDEPRFQQYELLNNYRSKANIVSFFTRFSSIIDQRLKTNSLISKSNGQGRISLVRYQDSDYYYNILNSVKNNTSDDIAILAKTNDEVLLIYSMLISEGVKARYITSQSDFKLGSLCELKEFLDDWKKNSDFSISRDRSDRVYRESKNNILKNAVLDRFEDEYESEIQKSQKHFMSVFEQYLRVIEFDEFDFGKSKVVVSTIHKSKGKEWSDVYLCAKEGFIDNNVQQSVYDKRLAYVAITRAKNNLYIHSKIALFDNFKDCYDETDVCKTQFDAVDKKVLLMGLGDIALTNRYSESGICKSLPMAGQKVSVVDKGQHVNLYKDRWQVAALSENIIRKVRAQQGYKLDNEAEIENVVAWEDKKDGKTYKQVLCKIFLSKDV
ncbi:MAG: RecQ family ATP-dependent DNA helicase [Gammaproteobacteria bacterium]|nr:RecQ family ATP-dependent DNA helicase [Gammaproteobacteria bacterium]